MYNYSLETENRIANFVVSMQANFALCNKKTSFSEKKEVFLITVLVVDDHELVRTGICRMLEDHPDVDVVGQAESGEEAIALVRQKTSAGGAVRCKHAWHWWG